MDSGIEEYRGKGMQVSKLERDLQALSLELSWIKEEDRIITAGWNINDHAELQMKILECVTARVMYDLNSDNKENILGFQLSTESMEAVAICTMDFFYKNYKKRIGRMKSLKNYPTIVNRLLAIAIDAPSANARPSDSIAAMKQFMEITDKEQVDTINTAIIGIGIMGTHSSYDPSDSLA